MIHKICMIDRQELFSLPPLGHLGVVVLNNFPDCKVGEDIKFQLFDDVIVEGVITAIEGRDSNIRPDIQGKSSQKFKLHWVPVRPEQVAKIITEFTAYKCPKGCKGRSVVQQTIKTEGVSIIRYRRCPKCKTRWQSIESFLKVVESNARPRRR